MHVCNRGGNSGERLIKNGKRIESKDDNVAELTTLADRFMSGSCRSSGRCV